LVDGSIELQKKDADSVVVQDIDRSIYLRNVYMKFAGYWSGTQPIPIRILP
jgi:hypothetical protein